MLGPKICLIGLNHTPSQFLWQRGLNKKSNLFAKETVQYGQ
jgi:hypothetical protein